MISPSSSIPKALRPDDLPEGAQELYNSLRMAVKRNGISSVQTLLAHARQTVNFRAILCCTDDTGATLLGNASEDGRLDVVKALVEAGTPLDLFCGATYPPLSRAANNGHLKVVRYLREQGADISFAQPVTGETILMKAVGRRQIKVALYLIENGAACGEDVGSKPGFTTCGMAAGLRMPEVVIAMFERGALPDPVVVLQKAVHHDSFPVVEACLAHPELCKPVLDERYETILASCRSVELRQMILSWRSEQAIVAAFGGESEDHAAPSPVRSKATPSL